MHKYSSYNRNNIITLQVQLILTRKVNLKAHEAERIFGDNEVLVSLATKGGLNV